MAKLPSLLELQLHHCNLSNFMTNPPIEHLILPSLKTLVTSQNNFTSSIPDEFFNCIKNVTYLDLHMSNIDGDYACGRSNSVTPPVALSQVTPSQV